MLPAANAIATGPKVLPLILTFGGATVAGGYARSQSRTISQYRNQETVTTVKTEPAQSKPFDPFPHSAPESRSKFFSVVLESIFA